MRPVYAAATAVALVAVFLLGMSVSVESRPSFEDAAAAADSVETPTPDGLPEAAPPLPTATPSPEPTPQPPMVIYVQVPPQTIYVQVPQIGTVADTAGLQSPSPTPVIIVHTATPAPTLPPVTVRSLPPPGQPTPLPASESTSSSARSSFSSNPKPTATPVLTRGTVVVNFAGAPSQRPTVSEPFAVQPGQNAWTAVRDAVGQSNLTFQDFGGSLGVFITGFYGVHAQGNHFWEFFVNGQSSSVGVSAYIVRNGDVLEFRYSSF